MDQSIGYPLLMIGMVRLGLISNGAIDTPFRSSTGLKSK